MQTNVDIQLIKKMITEMKNKKPEIVMNLLQDINTYHIASACIGTAIQYKLDMFLIRCMLLDWSIDVTSKTPIYKQRFKINNMLIKLEKGEYQKMHKFLWLVKQYNAIVKPIKKMYIKQTTDETIIN